MLNKSVFFTYLGIFVLSSILSAGELQKVENFTLKDFTGKAHSLADYKESKAIVVMFIATRCPVSNAYNSRMVDLYNDYHGKNVAFIGINSNKQEDTEEIAQHSKDNNFAFPVLKDEQNVIADKFEAQVTPETFVMNPNFEILYHGRIDDSQREEEVKVRDLCNALDEILAGKSVGTTETKAFGCTIKRVSK
jgi:peroxiredoxin